MDKKINHWCVVCGKGYHACDSCNDTKTFTPWRVLADTPEHFAIFMVLRDYNNGVISKDEAKDMLSNYDLREKDTFKDSAKKLITDIFNDDTSKTKRKTKNIDAENQDDNSTSVTITDTSENFE